MSRITPLDGIRGATATFSLPPGETFDPAAWCLVTHITGPESAPNTVTTQPVVSEIEPGHKDHYTFSRSRASAPTPCARSRSISGAG